MSSTSKHHSACLGKISELGREPGHDHILLARLELFTRDHVLAAETQRQSQSSECLIWNEMPMEQIRASATPIVRKLFKGILRKNPPSSLG